MDPPKSTSLMSALGDDFSKFQLVHVADENDVVSVNKRQRLENLLEKLCDTRKRKEGGQ